MPKRWRVCQPKKGRKCSCKLGYTGKNCKVDIDECESLPCFNGGTCENKSGSFNCTCVAGYTGVHCETAYFSTIKSPNYPSNYESSQTKTWMLSVPSGRLSLYFYDFDVESFYDDVELRWLIRIFSTFGYFKWNRSKKQNIYCIWKLHVCQV